MRLFQGRSNKQPARVLCPFCLNMVVLGQKIRPLPWHGEMTVDVCPKCNEVYPPAFRIPNPDNVVILSGIGFERHGKTVYMSSLFHVLRRILPGYWPGYYIDILDKRSHDEVTLRIGQLTKERKVPDRTPTSFPRPTIIIQKQTYVGGQFAEEVGTLFYDTGGESFQSAPLMQENARYTAQARTALFIVGLPELLSSNFPGDMLDDLLQVYVQGMRGLGANLSLQQLVIVYTKADCVMAHLPKWIRDYLETGHNAYPRPENLSSYYRGMECASGLLRKYTEHQLRARGFRNMADQFEDVHFCTVSALGSAPVGKELVTDISPCRVLDPFLWAMRTPGTQRRKTQKGSWFGLG